MRSERLLGFFESNLSKPLSNDELARIRVTFTPEVLIPSEFTVRKPIERNTEAELTDFLLDYDQEWLLKCDLDLSDEAKRTSQDFGVRLVNGVAGSGKSLIIVYRALLLRRLFPQKRILVLTHNRPLIQDLEARYKVLSNGDHGVEWRTFLSWCLSLYPNDIEAGDRIGKTTREKLMREIWNDHLCETALTPSMLESEIDWFKDRLLSKRSDYIVADRTGRGFALQESMRSRIYEAMVDYSGRLSQRGLIDWGDVPRQLWGMIDSRELDLPQYDVILVDEAQFFAPIWFELIKKLIHPVTGHLFLVADPTQGFLNRGQSWLSSGLEVRGRSHRLDRSYRTTRQILDFAIYLYRSRVPLDEEDIVVPNLLDMPDGVLPVILPMTSPQDEITRVVNEINELVQAKVPKGQILVIHSDWTGVDAIIDRLNTVLGADSAVDPKDEHHGDQIRVCTLNAVTGLESPIVFLVGLHLLYEHEQSLRISDEERVELVRDNTRKIYMAITRAGQRVVITYSGEIPGWLRINPGS
jgi:superfamily I DNA/RNA helicase